METVKSKLFKKYLKKRKSRSRFCLLIGYMSLKKNLENFNSVVAGANKVGQVVSFWISFDPNFTIYGKRKKSKLYILKNVGLSTFKERL